MKAWFDGKKVCTDDDGDFDVWIRTSESMLAELLACNPNLTVEGEWVGYDFIVEGVLCANDGWLKDEDYVPAFRRCGIAVSEQ